MEKYDVIIVGAGPGGLRCAEKLCQSDKKVLLLEKNSKIGPKVCAGGLSRKSCELLNLPEEITERSHDSCIFNTTKMKTRLELGGIFGYTVSREKLGQWQLDKIKNTAIDIRTEAEVIKITDNSVELRSGEIFEYKYLVGADGSNSQVRKFLKIPTKLIGVAFQYLIPGNFSDTEIFLDSKLFNSWYAYIFPHKDFAAIGAGCFPKIISVNIVRENFKKWAGMKNIDISKGKFEAFPLNCDYRGFKFGNIFLIGDAAGLASGFTGEGIYQALISGEEAANVILNPHYVPRRIRKLRHEVWVHHIMLVFVFLTGPFRNQFFNLITYCVKNKYIARTLVRILT